LEKSGVYQVLILKQTTCTVEIRLSTQMECRIMDGLIAFFFIL